MKKRIFALAVAICLLLSLGACGEKEETKKAEKKPTITWVTTGIGSLLPTPESGKVEITYDSADSFEADVTDITKEDFSKYVEECKKNGFTVDYYGSSDSYDAKDKNGNSLSINYYDDENKMNIDIYNYNDDEDEDDEEIEEETTKAKTTKPETTVPATTKAKEKTTKPAKTSSGVNPEFKETMDSYEEFFDEYVEFMKKYKESDDITSMMSDYADYMSKYTDMMQKLNSIDTGSLSADDYAYYAEVNARITKKLAEVAQ